MKQTYSSLMESAPEQVGRKFLTQEFYAGAQILEPSAENKAINILSEGTAEVILGDAEWGGSYIGAGGSPFRIPRPWALCWSSTGRTSEKEGEKTC